MAITLRKLTYFNCEQKDIAVKAEGIINKTLMNADFQNKVRSAVFTENQNLDSKEVLSKVLEDIEVELVAYRSWWVWSRVVAYVNSYKDNNRIYYNMRRITTPTDFASTVLHEALHLKGFSHYDAWSTSVPYLVQELFLQSTK